MQLNQFNVTIQIKNPATGAWVNLGIWDKVSGGDVTSAITKYQPGGGQKEIVLSNKASRADLVASKDCDVDIDWPLIELLESWCGNADASITLQATRPNYDATGIKPRPIVGTLTGVAGPSPDSTSAEVGLLQLTFGVTA